jgi:hypothetical protein
MRRNNMAFEVPFTNKPEDVGKLLHVLPTVQPPEKVDAGYIKSLGFSAASSTHLFEILKQLGFVDEADKPSADWLAYVADEKRGLVLAVAIKRAYGDLFTTTLCPYLEDNDALLDYFNLKVKASPKEMVLIIETFRYLTEPADFQDVLCPEEISTQDEITGPEVKVNPNLQLNIQVHIDPNTPDEKIDAIFRSMRKYLLGKEDQ